MPWWQILLVFAGIPALVFALITTAVWRFTTARVPDGLLQAEMSERGQNNDTQEDESDDQPRSADPAEENSNDAREGSEPGPDDH